MSPRTQTTHRASAGRRHPLFVRRIALGTTGALIAGVGMLAGATGAAAAVPTFPDNLLVFPDRDFVSVEGYADHAGQIALLEVTRPGAGVVGSATARVSGTDVAFEVNHPGGVCWGNNTSVKVTPDILAGDIVSISFNGQRAGETTVADAAVTTAPTVDGNILTVRGHIDPQKVNTDFTEQRIIQPAFKDTAVNRRDVRALPGDPAAAPKGGYTSQLQFSGDTFVATYTFDTPELAQLAADESSGPRMMAWQEVDLAGNRQGLTIAEFGESGGPGMGGCPNGPLLSGPAAPTNIRALALGTGTAPATVGTVTGVKLTWTPAVAVAGTPPILGYRVTAVADTANAAGEQTALQVRVPNPSATGTTLKGLDPNETYTLEVESLSRVGVTMPAVPMDIEIDVTPPLLTPTPVGGTFTTAQTVTLGSNEPGTDIYYTLDGTNPTEADVLSIAAKAYDGPIAITETTTLNYVGFDSSSNVSLIGTQVYTITNTPVPATPTALEAIPGIGSATVSWTGDALATGYSVQLYDAVGTPVGDPRLVAAGTTSLPISGLTTDTTFTFTVTATNANGSSAESAKSAPFTTQGPITANAGPDQTVARAVTPPTVTLSSAGSTTVGATYLWTQVLTGATDPDKVTLTGATTATAKFALPLYKFPMTNKPLTFQLTVTVNGATKTDTVVITPKPDTVQFATARWKAGDFRITGGGSTAGGTVTVHKGSLSGAVMGTGGLVAAVPPAVGSTFDIRIRTTGGVFATNPGTIWIESSLGGTAGPFTVSN